jgi:hypothetical protein
MSNGKKGMLECWSVGVMEYWNFGWGKSACLPAYEFESKEKRVLVHLCIVGLTTKDTKSTTVENINSGSS